jgi:hypothetical protein
MVLHRPVELALRFRQLRLIVSPIPQAAGDGLHLVTTESPRNGVDQCVTPKGLNCWCPIWQFIGTQSWLTYKPVVRVLCSYDGDETLGHRATSINRENRPLPDGLGGGLENHADAV